ncbi:MAG TPA: YebC/PmpR family DNA-binding transcriptional regulator [Myxococcota bacterium]|nr:YebC/PmpR family DNA-binding transcriptional regulator [Myxococcota bacterium]HND29079.1 YebC/PmpR family DNA-binding transcriptional regulator [Myxococcota bacterium]HNH46100.1 YebC/PmpR family DNA-binding transcriptional regulator [Myxococcota bacterium]
MGAQWKHKGRLEGGAKKGALFTRLSKEIIIACKSGDPSPEANARLRAALENARKNSMPKDTIERAMKKGRGELDEGVIYETVTYEGFCPHQVPIMVECVTENRNRTAQDIRTIFRKGQLGAVAWMYDRRGLIEATHPKGADAEEAAIEAGAQDVSVSEDGVEFICDAPDLDAVSRALQGMGWVISTMELGWVPKNRVSLEGDALADVQAFLELLDDCDDVQRIYTALA